MTDGRAGGLAGSDRVTELGRSGAVSGEQPEWTVLVPACNEAAAIADTVRDVRQALDELGVSHEVLIVDDGSRDGTGAIADRLAAADPQVRVVHHPSNLGIGSGFATGVRHAHGQWLILIPADLAIDLGDLALYRRASREADIVVGVRSDRRDYSAYRQLVSRLNILLVQRLFRLPLRQFNYISLYRLAVLRRLPIRYHSSAFFFAEVLIRARDAGYRLAEVDVRYVPRRSGRATGARLGLVLRTGRDMLHFWLARCRKGA